MDFRHENRIKIIQNLFAYSFSRLKKNLPYSQDKITSEITVNSKVINKSIEEYAPKFPIKNMAKIDLAILQLAIYELLINPKEPKKVVINEAVDLAKELGGEKSYSFINGVLGKVVNNINK